MDGEEWFGYMKEKEKEIVRRGRRRSDGEMRRESEREIRREKVVWRRKRKG